MAPLGFLFQLCLFRAELPGLRGIFLLPAGGFRDCRMGLFPLLLRLFSPFFILFFPSAYLVGLIPINIQIIAGTIEKNTDL